MSVHVDEAECRQCRMHDGRGYGLIEDTDWSLGVATQDAAAAAAADGGGGAVVMMRVCRIISQLSVTNK